jgi:hypothetical protein
MKLKQARTIIADEHKPPAHGKAGKHGSPDAEATDDNGDGLTDTARRILEIAERLLPSRAWSRWHYGRSWWKAARRTAPPCTTTSGHARPW